MSVTHMMFYLWIWKYKRDQKKNKLCVCVYVCTRLRVRTCMFLYKHTPPVKYVQSVYTYKQVENNQPVH